MYWSEVNIFFSTVSKIKLYDVQMFKMYFREGTMYGLGRCYHQYKVNNTHRLYISFIIEIDDLQTKISLNFTLVRGFVYVLSEKYRIFH